MSEGDRSSPAGRVKAQTLRPKRNVVKEEEGITVSFMQTEFAQLEYLNKKWREK